MLQRNEGHGGRSGVGAVLRFAFGVPHAELGGEAAGVKVVGVRRS